MPGRCLHIRRTLLLPGVRPWWLGVVTVALLHLPLCHFSRISLSLFRRYSRQMLQIQMWDLENGIKGIQKSSKRVCETGDQ
jgi:hypothetical protein